jgi:hypothetical protein
LWTQMRHNLPKPLSVEQAVDQLIILYHG